jgi:hypothetical protein
MNKIQARNMLEIVVKHFSKNPKELRCLSASGNCKYSYQKNVPKSNGCAIGMFLPNNLCLEMDNSGNTDINSILDEPNLYKKLPKWMQSMDSMFLAKLQVLHDDNHYWTNTNISKEGKEYINKIINVYNLGKPMFRVTTQKSIIYKQI